MVRRRELETLGRWSGETKCVEATEGVGCWLSGGGRLSGYVLLNTLHDDFGVGVGALIDFGSSADMDGRCNRPGDGCTIEGESREWRGRWPDGGGGLEDGGVGGSGSRIGGSSTDDSGRSLMGGSGYRLWDGFCGGDSMRGSGSRLGGGRADRGCIFDDYDNIAGGSKDSGGSRLGSGSTDGGFSIDDSGSICRGGIGFDTGSTHSGSMVPRW